MWCKLTKIFKRTRHENTQHHMIILKTHMYTNVQEFGVREIFIWLFL